MQYVYMLLAATACSIAAAARPKGVILMMMGTWLAEAQRGHTRADRLLV